MNIEHSTLHLPKKRTRKKIKMDKNEGDGRKSSKK